MPSICLVTSAACASASVDQVDGSSFSAHSRWRVRRERSAAARVRSSWPGLYSHPPARPRSPASARLSRQRGTRSKATRSALMRATVLAPAGLSGAKFARALNISLALGVPCLAPGRLRFLGHGASAPSRRVRVLDAPRDHWWPGPLEKKMRLPIFRNGSPFGCFR